MKPLSETGPGLLVIQIPIQAVCTGMTLEWLWIDTEMKFLKKYKKQLTSPTMPTGQEHLYPNSEFSTGMQSLCSGQGFLAHSFMIWSQLSPANPSWQWHTGSWTCLGPTKDKTSVAMLTIAVSSIRTSSLEKVRKHIICEELALVSNLFSKVVEGLGTI